LTISARQEGFYFYSQLRSQRILAFRGLPNFTKHDNIYSSSGVTPAEYKEEAEMTEKIYAAIGHFKDSKNVVSVVFKQRTRKDFMTDCYCNGFTPYVVMTETMLNKIFNDCRNGSDVFDQVKKLTTNYRVWNIVTEYLTNAGYLITDRIKDIDENAFQALTVNQY
jgi:hypothetical protein